MKKKWTKQREKNKKKLSKTNGSENTPVFLFFKSKLFFSFFFSFQSGFKTLCKCNRAHTYTKYGKNFCLHHITYAKQKKKKSLRRKIVNILEIKEKAGYVVLIKFVYYMNFCLINSCSCRSLIFFLDFFLCFPLHFFLLSHFFFRLYRCCWILIMILALFWKIIIFPHSFFSFIFNSSTQLLWIWPRHICFSTYIIIFFAWQSTFFHR